MPARAAFGHSVDYRSVVVHGTATVVDDDGETAAALDALVDAVVPGRAAASRPGRGKELAATTVLRLPLTMTPGAPVPAPELPPDAEVPEHVRSWARPVGG